MGGRVGMAWCSRGAHGMQWACLGARRHEGRSERCTHSVRAAQAGFHDPVPSPWMPISPASCPTVCMKIRHRKINYKYKKKNLEMRVLLPMDILSTHPFPTPSSDTHHVSILFSGISDTER